MAKKQIVSLILTFVILFSAFFAGCVELNTDDKTKELKEPELEGKSLVLPNWSDGDYHDYQKTCSFLKDLNRRFPNYVEVFSIGESVENRELNCICITNETNTKTKYSCIIDGCIHGCEWEAGESCLYLAEYLLINSDNESIKEILDSGEIYFIPLVNPDGREIDSRYNANGIDLCRNFDIDFGRWRGSAIRLGKFLGKRGFSIVYIPFFGWINNCGWKPFSEPETQALKDFMEQIDDNTNFSFYLNCHTAVHNFIVPWTAYKPPFKISEEKRNLFDYTLDWVSSNSEYEKETLGYNASGTAVDWCFKEFNIPCFTLEILSKDYEPFTGGGKHDNLVHWMKTTVPVFMFMLVNIENFYNWETPNIQPVLPSGIPPEPIK